MQLLDTIYRLVKSFGSEWVERAPYEELFRRYKRANISEKGQIYYEFCSRLSRLVYRASQDYVQRGKTAESDDSVEKLKDRVFRSFAPDMAAGDPDYGLRRFGTHISNILDKEAFDCIARAFYYQLPIYHIANDEQRRILAAMLQAEMSKKKGSSYVEQVAEDFCMSPERVKVVMKAANKRLEYVIDNDFEREELRELTQGYLPRYRKKD